MTNANTADSPLEAATSAAAPRVSGVSELVSNGVGLTDPFGGTTANGYRQDGTCHHRYYPS